MVRRGRDVAFLGLNKERLGHDSGQDFVKTPR